VIAGVLAAAGDQTLALIISAGLLGAFTENHVSYCQSHLELKAPA
jgi:membrane protein DedA with SNARE-associated domain